MEFGKTGKTNRTGGKAECEAEIASWVIWLEDSLFPPSAQGLQAYTGVMTWVPWFISARLLEMQPWNSEKCLVAHSEMICGK
jgi:hypothetical protein